MKLLALFLLCCWATGATLTSVWLMTKLEERFGLAVAASALPFWLCGAIAGGMWLVVAVGGL